MIEAINSLRLLVKNISFDEQPYVRGSKDSLDFTAMQDSFSKVNKTITTQKCETMGILVEHMGKWHPSYGGIILFGLDRDALFPGAVIRCARFQGTEKVNFLDQKTINTHLPLALDEAIAFIDKHISIRSVIGKTRRIDIPQYPEVAMREAIINALVHTDYAMGGTTVTIAIFDDRIEITNPGGLPFGMTIDQALTGSSRVRNYVIARVFNALQLIEQWGTGIKRINEACKENNLQPPLFQELGNQFRVTLYAGRAQKKVVRPWQEKIIEYLKANGQASSKEAAKLWKINARTARERLKQLVEAGIIKKIGTSPHDPYAVYVLLEV
jgi:ATP-dependent DNA helicase RecG